MSKIYFTFLSTLICFTSIAQDLSETITVRAGTSVSIASGTTLNAANVNLKSTSDSYSCLLLNGDLGSTTIVNYDRYVNVVGVSGVNGGNDLISMPVKETGDVTFGEFLNYSPDAGSTTNSDVIPNSSSTPTLYGFGPYDNSGPGYTNYDAAEDANVLLERGIGYRSASISGQTLRFTGKVSKLTETVTITTVGNNYWNLIGNPYPTYIDSQAFLAHNSSVLDPNATAIYGYNSGTESGPGTINNFTIINNITHNTLRIAPGQGFLVANDINTPTNQISFTTAMRTITGADDFILNRNENPNQMLRLLAEDSNASYPTEIYFNENSTLGLDPGYDAQIFSGGSSNIMLYSHLVQNDQGRKMAIQSLGFTDLNDVVIPLGLKAAQGRQVTISIESSTLPEESQVFLEDHLTNTYTLLNISDYTFTANTAISGSGRFFLRIGNSALSTPEQHSSDIKLYTKAKTIVIKGQLLEDTNASVYDIQGRSVLTYHLEGGSEENSLDASSLSSGIYVVKLINATQEYTQKVVIK